MPQEGTSSYPAGLDDFNVPSNPETTPLGSAGDADRDHATLLADMGAAIEAVEGELGLDPAGASATVKARLDTHDANTDAHHAKSHTHSGDGSGSVAHSSLTGVTANQHHNQSHANSDHSDRFTALNVTEVGTGANTSETDLQTATLTANSLGTTGVLEVEAWGTMTGTAGDRTVRLYFGATQIAIFTQAAAAAAVDWHVKATIAADGATNAQKIAVRILSGDVAVEQIDVTTAAIDTTANVTIKTTGQTADAADEISSEVLLVRRVI